MAAVHHHARSLVLAVVFSVFVAHGEPFGEECAVALPRTFFLQTKSSMSTAPFNDAPASRTGSPRERSKPDFDFEDKLWDGQDMYANDENTIQLLASRLAEDDILRRFQIMGQFNSGTNLLESLIKKNFPSKFDISGQRMNDQMTRPCFFWKHASLSVLRENQPSVFQACVEDKVIGVAMVRNPLSWLMSMKRVAYDLHDCNQGGDWLSRPCTYPLSSPANLGNHEFSSVENIWSLWLHDYESLPSFGFQGSALIRYEDLVLKPEEELRKIAAIANVTLSGDVKLEDDAVHPSAVVRSNGRQRAIQKLNSKSYLSEYTEQELKDACSRLDADLMHRYGYDDCVGVFTG